MAIKIGILGYGNLGRGIECAIKQNDDVELAGVFTRRDPSTVKIMTEGVKVYSVDDAPKMKDEIDVMILCGGSATCIWASWAVPPSASSLTALMSRLLLTA